MVVTGMAFQIMSGRSKDNRKDNENVIKHQIWYVITIYGM